MSNKSFLRSIFLSSFILLAFFSCQNDGLFSNNKLPEANFSISQVACDTPPCEVQFVNESIEAVSYIWDFGDGSSTSTEEDPIHVYDDIAQYTVTLTAINENGETKKTKELYLDNSSPAVIDNSSPYWLYGGGYSFPGSFRNHHYEFEVKENNAAIEIILESADVDVYVWLFNTLGEITDLTGGYRSATISKTLNSGKYKVVAGSYYRGAIGNYTLVVKENEKEINTTRILSQNLSVEDGLWDTGGGGFNFYSLRNHIYTFEITENNTAVDIILQSDDTEVSLYLNSPTVSYIDHKYGNRSEFVVWNLNAGTYIITAATYSRDQPPSDYLLDIEGKVANLQKVESDQFKIENVEWTTWGGGIAHPNSFRNHVYTIEVSENNYPLDIIVQSEVADLSVWLFGLDGGNNYLHTYGRKKEFLNTEVDAGTYTLEVGTYERGVFDAAYDLDVVGKIASIDRIPSQDTIVTGSWEYGSGTGNPDSDDNGRYTFEVTENNSSVDIILESNDVPVCMWLYGPDISGFVWDYGSNRRYIVQNVNAGTYTIVAGTYSEGAIGDYQLSVVGQFANFKEE